MIIAVAGPYSASSEEGRRANLEALNKAAAELLVRGHTPLIGVNAALPVIEWASVSIDHYEAIMAISMAVISSCEAILLIAESPGANRERDFFLEKSLPVYYSIEEIPAAGTCH